MTTGHCPTTVRTSSSPVATHVIDDLADDFEALRSGRPGFKVTSMFQALPPLHLGRYDDAFTEVLPGGDQGRGGEAASGVRGGLALPVGRTGSARVPTASPWRRFLGGGGPGPGAGWGSGS